MKNDYEISWSYIVNVEPMLRRRPCREVGTGTERGRVANKGGGAPPLILHQSVSSPSKCNLLLPTTFYGLNLLPS